MRWPTALDNRTIALTISMVAACGGGNDAPVERMCSHACDCRADCSQSDIQECIETYGEVRDQLEEAGCAEPYDDFALCLADKDCDDSWLAVCDEQFTAFRECQGIPGFGDRNE
jgi:hypothetical protein